MFAPFVVDRDDEVQLRGHGAVPLRRRRDRPPAAVAVRDADRLDQLLDPEPGPQAGLHGPPRGDRIDEPPDDRRRGRDPAGARRVGAVRDRDRGERHAVARPDREREARDVVGRAVLEDEGPPRPVDLEPVPGAEEGVGRDREGARDAPGEVEPGVDPRVARRARWAQPRGDPLDRAEEPFQVVEAVRGEVVEGTPPVLEPELPGVATHAVSIGLDPPGQGHVPQRAELAAPEDLPGRLPGRDLGEDEVDGVGDARPLDRPEHPPRLPDRGRDRLLAEDVLPGRRRGPHDLRLEGGRDGDCQRINRRVVDRRAPVARGAGDAQPVGDLARRSARLAQIATTSQRPSARKAGTWTCCP